MARETPAFKIRNANPPLFVLHAQTSDMAEFKRQLAEQLAKTPDFFAAAPVALGLAGIAESEVAPDFADLTAFARAHGLCLAGVLGGSESQRRAAAAAGLGLFPDKPEKKPAREAPEPIQEPPPPPPPPPPAVPAPKPQARPTLVVDKPVRAGQLIRAEGSDLVVLAIVNAGAELIADGDIHVYAPLRGKALAGARGDASARIFALAMEAELVSIAGCYKVFENGMPEEVRGKPAQVLLEGEKVNLKPLTPVR